MDEDRLVLAGIDEAGLGPLLGPLVVGAAAVSLPRFDIADESCLPGHPDLWKLLDAAIAPRPADAGRRTVICDSKLLHNLKSIRPVEESVLAFAGALGAFARADAGDGPVDRVDLPADFRAFLQRFSIAPIEPLDDYPWYAGPGLGMRVPIESLADKCAMRGISLQRAAQDAGIRIEGIRVRPVAVSEFNDLMQLAGTKADAHFAVICGVIGKLWQRFPRLRVVVDKQGGRHFYGDHLQRQFRDATVRPVVEAQTLPREPTAPSAGKKKPKEQAKARAAARGKPAKPDLPLYSSYRLHEPETGREMTIDFCQDGERVSMLVAVASLFAKYTREHCVNALNAFWAARYPGLKPTKGYVQDGRRFLDDLAANGADDLDALRRVMVRDK